MIHRSQDPAQGLIMYDIDFIWQECHDNVVTVMDAVYRFRITGTSWGNSPGPSQRVNDAESSGVLLLLA